MSANYWQKGETLDYTPDAAIQAGDVVSLNTRIGVAGTDAGAGETCPLHMVGVFELPKAKEAVTLGAALFYSMADSVVTATAAGNIPAGYAVTPAAEADPTVFVKLLG